MDTIFLILERFNHYSDALRGEFIKALAEKFQVIVLTPDLDDEVVRRYRYFQHPRVVYRTIRVSSPRIWHLSENYMRKYFVRAYDALLTTQCLYYWYPQRFFDRFLRDAGGLLPRRWMTPELFTRLEMSIVRPSDEFVRLVREYGPALAVVPTPGYGFLPLVAETVVYCRRMGLPTVAVNASFDHPYTMPKFLRKTDFMTVWNERMRDETIRMHGYVPAEVRVTGCLKFDHYFQHVRERRLRPREVFLRSKGLDPEKKTVVYATPTPGTYKHRRDLVRDIIRLREEGKMKGDPNILVRLHPFDVWKTYEEFTNIPRVHIERAGTYRGFDETTPGPKVEMDGCDLVNQSETFFHCDVVINLSSTTVIEAHIFDKPTVVVGWPDRHRRALLAEVPRMFVENGAVRVASTIEELGALVSRYLEHPQLDRAERERNVREFAFFTDGHSYQRIADFTEDIVREQKTYGTVA